MSGVLFAIEFVFYLLSCLVAVVSFVYINYIFIRKSFSRISNLLISYLFYLFLLLLMFLMPRFYIVVVAYFTPSTWAYNNASISMVFWMFFVLPYFVFFNITLFIVLIIKIFRHKKPPQTESDSIEALYKLQKV